MTLSPRKREQLVGFLATLPNSAALTLFGALEQDKASGARDLPHQTLLNTLREQLNLRGGGFPNRIVDARRLFFQPFEPFLLHRERRRKRDGQIGRSSIEPIWRILKTEDGCMAAAMAAARLDDALSVVEPDPREIERCHRELFTAAETGLAQLVENANKSESFEKDLVHLLGGQNVYDDLRELRILLGGVDLWEQMRALAPSSSVSVSEENIYSIRSLFFRAVERSQALGYYCLLALKGLFNKPWHAMAVYYHLSRASDARIASARDVIEGLPESLFLDIEDIARRLERQCSHPFDGPLCSVQIEYFSDYSAGLMRYASDAGDNVFANRIEACREVVGETHIRFCEKALGVIRDATPVRDAGGVSRLVALRPDINAGLPRETLEIAREGAVYLSTASDVAARLAGDSGYVGETTDLATDHMRTYLNDLVMEIRAGEGELRSYARDTFANAARIAEPLLESDEIGLLRDRAAAAAVTA